MDLRGDFQRRYPRLGAGLAEAVLPLQAARQLEALVAVAAAETDDTTGPLQRPAVVLLHGPAGCGKTHTAQLLAAALGCDLLVPLAKDGPGLVQFLARVGRGRKAMLLLDAIDTAPRWQAETSVLAALAAEPPLPIVLTARTLAAVPDGLRVHLDEVIHLPFPRQPEREALWTSLLGEAQQLADDVDVAALAVVPLTGAGVAAAVRGAVRDARAARGAKLDQQRLLAAARRAADLRDAPPPPVLDPAAASHFANLGALVPAWQRLRAGGDEGAAPVVLLDGPLGVGKRTAAASLLASWGLPVDVWRASQLGEADGHAERAVLLTEADGWPAAAAQTAARLLRASGRPALLTAQRFGSLDPALRELVRERLTLAAPGLAERRLLWIALSPPDLWGEGDGTEPPVALSLTGAQIRSAIDRGRWAAAAAGETPTSAGLQRAARDEAEAAGLLVRMPTADATERSEPPAGV